MAKTLLLMRHAKSSWDQPGLSDIERPLNQRGRLASVLMGQFLTDQKRVPDTVMLSPATRVQQTWDHLRRTLFRFSGTVSTHDAIYSSGSDALIKLLEFSPPSCDTLLMIAHQPTLSTLVQSLTGNGLPDFPTAGLAELRLDNMWQNLRENQCTLVAFTRPKQLV